jgi:hypothetical protein
MGSVYQATAHTAATAPKAETTPAINGNKAPMELTTGAILSPIVCGIYFKLVFALAQPFARASLVLYLPFFKAPLSISSLFPPISLVTTVTKTGSVSSLVLQAAISALASAKRTSTSLSISSEFAASKNSNSASASAF